MIFEISGVTTHPLIPVFVAFGISLITSTAGVSGAFLILPFQMSILGYTTPSVSGTNHFFNVIGIPGGIVSYIREGRMLWPLALIIIVGTMPGVILGAIIRLKYLPDPQYFKIFAGFVLLYISIRLIKEIFKKNITKSKKSFDKKHFPKTNVVSFNYKNFIFEFNSEEYSVSVLSLATLSLFVGMVGGIYGVGGGAIIAPFLVSFLGLPIYSVAGAALMGTFTTSVVGVIFYQMLSIWYPESNIAPDWLLGLFFGFGGLLGMYLGGKIQKYLPARLIKTILSLLILFIAIKYLTEILKII